MPGYPARQRLRRSVSDVLAVPGGGEQVGDQVVTVHEFDGVDGGTAAEDVIFRSCDVEGCEGGGEEYREEKEVGERVAHG